MASKLTVRFGEQIQIKTAVGFTIIVGGSPDEVVTAFQPILKQVGNCPKFHDLALAGLASRFTRLMPQPIRRF